MFVNSNSSYGFPRPKQANNMYTDSDFSSFYTNAADHEEAHNSVQGSPMMASPWNNVLSPFNKPNFVYPIPPFPGNYTLVGSLVREEGHVYSLATKPGDLLYTGSDSKNIRVWKNFKDYGGFKSASGLVKAIVISGDKIFTGHQDGKIRVWKVSPKDASVHKRYGSLPTLKDLFKYSMRPSNYIEVKRRRSVWIKHSDAISCLSLVEDEGLLYSSSWDQTFKVWRISDSKCLESVMAHEDSVNAVVNGTDAIVYTGSADGTVKVWRREMQGKVTKHFLVRTLMKQECAVTALAVDPTESVLYCGSSDGLVNFWDRKRSLAHGGALRGHKLAVLCLVARGTLVFSGSTDKSICVWRRDGMEHMRIFVLSGHAGPVKCLAVEEDKEKGKWKLYSGSLDKSVKVWSVGEQSVGMVQHQAIDVGSGVEKFSSDSSIFRLR